MVLICIFLAVSDVEYLFHLSIGHPYVVFGEMSIQEQDLDLIKTNK